MNKPPSKREEAILFTILAVTAAIITAAGIITTLVLAHNGVITSDAPTRMRPLLLLYVCATVAATWKAASCWRQVPRR